MADLGSRIEQKLSSLLFVANVRDGRSCLDELEANGSAEEGRVVGPEEETAGPQCRPWHRSDLFKRLRTFKPSTWFAKPAVIGPFECARRGWVISGPDMLVCEFCKAYLSCSIKSPSVAMDNNLQRAASRFAEQLVSGHDADCPWRKAVSDASLLGFPPVQPKALLDSYMRRAAALAGVHELPRVCEQAVARMSKTHASKLAALLEAADVLPEATTTAATTGAQARPALEAAAAEGGGAAKRAAEAGGGGHSDNNDDDNGCEFLRVVKILALCGWDVHALPCPPVMALASTATASSAGPAQFSPPSRMLMEAAAEKSVSADRAVLQCRICDAKVGMWNVAPALRVRPPAAAAAGERDDKQDDSAQPRQSMPRRPQLQPQPSPPMEPPPLALSQPATGDAAARPNGGAAAAPAPGGGAAKEPPQAKAAVPAAGAAAGQSQQPEADGSAAAFLRRTRLQQRLRQQQQGGAAGLQEQQKRAAMSAPGAAAGGAAADAAAVRSPAAAVGATAAVAERAGGQAQRQSAPGILDLLSQHSIAGGPLQTAQLSVGGAEPSGLRPTASSSAAAAVPRLRSGSGLAAPAAAVAAAAGASCSSAGSLGTLEDSQAAAAAAAAGGPFGMGHTPVFGLGTLEAGGSKRPRDQMSALTGSSVPQQLPPPLQPQQLPSAAAASAEPAVRAKRLRVQGAGSSFAAAQPCHEEGSPSAATLPGSSLVSHAAAADDSSPMHQEQGARTLHRAAPAAAAGRGAATGSMVGGGGEDGCWVSITAGSLDGMSLREGDQDRIAVMLEATDEGDGASGGAALAADDGASVEQRSRLQRIAAGGAGSAATAAWLADSPRCVAVPGRSFASDDIRGALGSHGSKHEQGEEGGEEGGDEAHTSSLLAADDSARAASQSSLLRPPLVMAALAITALSARAAAPPVTPPPDPRSVAALRSAAGGAVGAQAAAAHSIGHGVASHTSASTPNATSIAAAARTLLDGPGTTTVSQGGVSEAASDAQEARSHSTGACADHAGTAVAAAATAGAALAPAPAPASSFAHAPEQGGGERERERDDILSREGQARSCLQAFDRQGSDSVAMVVSEAGADDDDGRAEPTSRPPGAAPLPPPPPSDAPDPGFDPLTTHRPWCPYISTAAPAAAPAAAPGPTWRSGWMAQLDAVVPASGSAARPGAALAAQLPPASESTAVRQDPYRVTRRLQQLLAKVGGVKDKSQR